MRLTTVSAYIPILNSLPKHLRRKRYVGNVRLRWLLKVTAGMIWLAGGIIADELNSYASYEKKFLLKYANSVYNAKWCVLPIPLNEDSKDGRPLGSK